MKDRFKYDHIVPYIGVKPNLTLSFQCLISMLQETAIAHSNNTTLPFSWYAENKKGFLLINWHVRITGAYPKLYDRLTAYTWPVCFKGMSAQRSFAAVYEGGTEFASAVARWGFADIEQRRLTRIPDVVLSSYGNCYEPMFEPDYTLPETDGYTLLGEIPITARLCDIDSNYHVNNVKYIDWVINGVPEDMYYNMNVREMKTHYKKEVVLGEQLTLETYRKNGEIISLIKSGGALSAGVYTRWTMT